MSNAIFAILDEDVAYAKALSDYIYRSTTLGYQTCIFSNVEDFIISFKDKPVEVLLVSEALYTSFTFKQKELSLQLVNVYVLASIRGTTYKEPTFFKFQSAESLIHGIMSTLSTTKGFALNKEASTTNIITVYSPIGRCGKTTFAYTYAMILSLNSPTLFISFDEYCGYYFKENDKDLSDLFFYFLEDASSLNTKLGSLVCKCNGLDFILPARFSADLRRLDSKDVYRFISALKDTSYTNIVIDLGNTLCDIAPCLHLSNHVYIPKLTDSAAMHKLELFINSLSTLDGTFIDDIVSYIQVPAMEQDSNNIIMSNKLLVSPIAEFIKSTIIGYDNDR